MRPHKVQNVKWSCKASFRALGLTWIGECESFLDEEFIWLSGNGKTRPSVAAPTAKDIRGGSGP